MTDITELAPAMKAAAIDAKELAIIARYSKGRAAAEKFYALANPNNVIALVEALEKAQQHIARQEQILLNQDESLSIRRGELEVAQTERDEFRRRFNLERSILEDADKDLETLRQRIAELESRTVTIEPFRSFVTDADLAALHRFAECCDDPESGGHDLEKEQVRRLEAIGALQRSGRISYITGFGDFLISLTAGIKWEAE